MTGRLKQLIWILPMAIGGLVAALGWWGNDRLHATIEGELKAQLAATLNANVTALEIWLSNQTRLATALADDSKVRALASQISASSVVDSRISWFDNKVTPADAIDGLIVGGNTTGISSDGSTYNPPVPTQILNPYYAMPMYMYIAPAFP